MDWKTLFFSFRGRVNRAKYWLALLVILIVSAVFKGIRIIVVYNWEVVGEQDMADSVGGLVTLSVITLVVLAVSLTCFVAGLAIAAKRLHDRDKSAWWLLLFYLLPGVLAVTGAGASMATESWLALGLLGAIALAISIWALIELGCLRGTPGANQYGPDPLANG
jgi:uncharacterized membrane protein YhaH (DUF805 family)